MSASPPLSPPSSPAATSDAGPGGPVRDKVSAAGGPGPAAEEAAGATPVRPRFAEMHRLGRGGPLRTLLVLGATLAGGVGLTVAMGQVLILTGYATVLGRLRPGSGPGWALAPLDEAMVGFAFFMLSIIAHLAVFSVVAPLVHRRPWRSFVAPEPFRWRLFGWAFFSFAGLLLGTTALAHWSGAERLDFTFEGGKLLAYLPLALTLVPLQVLAEEVLFRGYLLQVVGRATGLFLVRLLVPAALFAALHLGNAEALYDAVWGPALFLLLSLYLGFLTLRQDGLESAVAVHLANNWIALFVVGSAISSMPTPTLWTVPAPDMRLGFFVLAGTCAAHYAVLRLAAPLWRR